MPASSFILIGADEAFRAETRPPTYFNICYRLQATQTARSITRLKFTDRRRHPVHPDGISHFVLGPCAPFSGPEAARRRYPHSRAQPQSASTIEAKSKTR